MPQLASSSSSISSLYVCQVDSVGEDHHLGDFGPVDVDSGSLSSLEGEGIGAVRLIFKLVRWGKTLVASGDNFGLRNGFACKMGTQDGFSARCRRRFFWCKLPRIGFYFCIIVFMFPLSLQSVDNVSQWDMHRMIAHNRFL